MNANPVLLQMKYARVINLYASTYSVSPLTALKDFYKSDLYTLISEGIGDMHCMSDMYLVEELRSELLKNGFIKA